MTCPSSACSANSSWSVPSVCPGAQPMQHFLLAHRADPTGHTLAAGLVAKEGRNAQQDGLHIDRLIQDHHHPRPQAGPDRPHARKGQGRIQLLGEDKRPGGATEQHRLQGAPIAYPARQGQ